MNNKVVEHMQPPTADQVQVDLHFSKGSSYYHVINIFTRNQSVCLQVAGDMPREEVALFAARIKGLGSI